MKYCLRFTSIFFLQIAFFMFLNILYHQKRYNFIIAEYSYE